MKSARTLRWLMQQAGGGYNPLALAGLLFFNSYKTAVQVLPQVRDNTSGAGRAITAVSGTTWRCGNTPGADAGAYHGGTLSLRNYVNAGNNGDFTTSGGSSVSTDYTNPAGVAEAVGIGLGPQVASMTGYCNSYTELLAARVFTQPTAAQCMALNTNVIPGKQILGQANVLSRTLSLNSAPVAGALNGTGDFTFLTYMRPAAVNVSGTSSRWMAFQDATPTSRILVGYGAAGTHTLQIADGAGLLTTINVVLSSPLLLNVWQLLAVVYSAGTATFYLNGVAVGSNSGTVRTRANLVNTFIGYRSSYPGGTGGTAGHRAIDAALSRAMTPAELVQLTAYCQAEYA